MNWSERDRQHIWHPYTQMHTSTDAPAVLRAEGAHLHLEDGRMLLDAISSWWVTTHGHAHPHIAQAIASQAHVLEQVIFAGFTHPQAVRLAERLVRLLPSSIQRVFFSDDGSTAVEVALKMAWQYWQNRNENRQRILALEDAYHGDTFGAMSASSRSVFTKAFAPLLFDVTHLPNPSSDAESCLRSLKSALTAGDVVTLIVEPLVMGAGGMRMYSPAVLDEMVRLCRSAGVPVVFDEVMTGFYRTGKMFAADHCQAEPDIICLSKGLTGGFLPMGLTACTDAIYNAFLSDERGKMLFHGHSFTGNALGCAAANASLDLFELPATQAQIAAICTAQSAFAARLAHHVHVRNVRVLGTILAFDLVTTTQGYLSTAAITLRDRMLAEGVLIRPLGEVVYLLPPYAMRLEELRQVHERLWAALS